MPDADGQLAPDAKGAALREALGRLGSAVVAFSGGVDSTFLLRVAHDVLGDNAIAVTARLSTVPDREINEAAAYCRALGVRHEILDFDAFAVPGFAENSPDRCYFCKKAIFTGIRAFAEANDCAAVLNKAREHFKERHGDEADAKLRALLESIIKNGSTNPNNDGLVIPWQKWRDYQPGRYLMAEIKQAELAAGIPIKRKPGKRKGGEE